MDEKSYLARNMHDAKMMRRGLAFIETVFHTTRLPFMSKINPWLKPDKTDMRWLPINQDIELPENAPMPITLLDRFIEETSHRVIYDKCGCRVGFECKDYSWDYGCLMMGDSAIEGWPGICHEASVEEAKQHAHAAVSSGLVPVVGKARIDNFIFDIPDRARMLTVCFCCDCCCLTKFMRYAPLKHLDPIFPRLDGVVVEVTDQCVGCGECAPHCYVAAITIEDGRATIGDYCRACGRCALVCPNDAISVRVTDPEFLDRAYERIRAHVKYD